MCECVRGLVAYLLPQRLKSMSFETFFFAPQGGGGCSVFEKISKKTPVILGFKGKKFGFPLNSTFYLISSHCVVNKANLPKQTFQHKKSLSMRAFMI